MHRRNQKKRIRRSREWRGLSQNVIRTVLAFRWRDDSTPYTMRDLARMRPLAVRCAAAILNVSRGHLDDFEAENLLSAELRRADGGDDFDPLQHVPEDYRLQNSLTFRNGGLRKVWQ